MLSQMRPYTPSLYQPDSFGRYRHYPRNVRTPIPGAGYQVGKMLWAEQELNLNGSSRPQPYGSYAAVPLRGLGQLGQQGVDPATIQRIMEQGFNVSFGPGAPAGATTAPPAPVVATASPRQSIWYSGGYPSPLLVGVVGLGLVGVAGGAWYLMSKKRVRANRRRRRSR